MTKPVTQTVSSEMDGRHQGAVDLSAMAGVPGEVEAPAQTPAGGSPYAGGVSQQHHQAAMATAGAPEAQVAIRGPLIIDVDERTFDHTMALSRAVPIILVLYTPKSLASRNALKIVEEVARKRAGEFQVGKVDVEASPTLASAFQAPAVPAGYALLAGRPLPLFEGVPTEAQMMQLVDDLLQVAAQAGVTTRLEVSGDDLERPVPPEHVPAREAEEHGDWSAAIAAWKKVLANNPGDTEAKTALVRSQFQARQEADQAAIASGDEEAALGAEADALFAKGDEGLAFDLLLSEMAETSDPDQRESLRLRLIELFQIASDKAAVKTARSRLATMLMV